MLGGLQLNIKRQILVVYESMGKFGPPAFQDTCENKLPAKILDVIGAFNEALNMLDFLFELQKQFKCGPWKHPLQVPSWWWPWGFRVSMLLITFIPLIQWPQLSWADVLFNQAVRGTV